MNTSLLAKFVASMPARLGALGESVAALEADASAVLIRGIGRELHTFKGEARLVGVPGIEKLAHAAEDVLFGHQRARQLGPNTVQLLYEALDGIFNCVQSLQADEPVDMEAVLALALRLSTSASTSPAATMADLPAASMPAPAAEPETATTAPQVDAADTSTPPRLTGMRTVQVRTATLDAIHKFTILGQGGIVRSRNQLETLWTQVQALRLDLATAPPQQRAAVEVLVANLRQFRARLADDTVVLGELKDVVNTARMRRIADIFISYPSFARQVAQSTQKQVRVELGRIEGEVEERVFSEIAEPCMHLLQNAIAHGIELPAARRQAGKDETGTLRIAAVQDGGTVRITLSDDGGGLDLDRLGKRAIELGLIDAAELASMDEPARMQLVFRAGLSTAAQVDALAGRGIGLDVVATVLARMGGSVQLTSQRHVGTSFVLRVPVSTSVMKVMLVESCGQIFGLPSDAIKQVACSPVTELHQVDGFESVDHQGRRLPLVRLRETLGLRGIKDLFVNKVVIIVLDDGVQRGGVIVERCLGEREILVNDFEAYLGSPATTSGVAVLEDDSILIVLDPSAMLNARRPKGHTSHQPSFTANAPRVGRVLYAEDSTITREYTADLLRGEGYDVVEVEDGIAALEALAGGQGSFDVLLTDLQMPRMDGIKLIATVRREEVGRHLPIVIMSTVDALETRRMALQSGADAYLVKADFALETLVATLRQVIR